MNFFRNPEIKRSLLHFLLAAACFAVAGYVFGISIAQGGELRIFGRVFSLGAVLALFALGIGLFFTLMYLFFTWQRYGHIRGLARNIDALLHGTDTLNFSDYEEGELSILKIELDKVVLRLREQSEGLKREKGHLAASMADISHQLRTPMTSIHLVLSLLSEPELSGQKRMELLHQMSMLLNRMDWLIEALLKVSRLDAGTVTFQQKHTSVAQVIQAAVEPLEIPMELRGQQFIFSGQNGTEAFFVDRSWTVEAIANILKNCMEHTPQDGCIRVTASQNAIFTELIIEDNGPGFAAEDLPHLFERFYKGKHSGEQSIGIGLALARMILSKQNATIKAENIPTGGARFILHFYLDSPIPN